VREDRNTPEWEEQPDGSRIRLSNGIRITDRRRASEPSRPEIEHLVADQEPGGAVVILGLDAGGKPVYTTILAE
jgi:hypothetical protein